MFIRLSCDSPMQKRREHTTFWGVKPYDAEQMGSQCGTIPHWVPPTLVLRHWGTVNTLELSHDHPTARLLEIPDMELTREAIAVLTPLELRQLRKDPSALTISSTVIFSLFCLVRWRGRGYRWDGGRVFSGRF
jgi:hypothetical protein